MFNFNWLNSEHSIKYLYSSCVACTQTGKHRSRTHIKTHPNDVDVDDEDVRRHRLLRDFIRCENYLKKKIKKWAYKRLYKQNKTKHKQRHMNWGVIRRIFACIWKYHDWVHYSILHTDMMVNNRHVRCTTTSWEIPVEIDSIDDFTFTCAFEHTPKYIATDMQNYWINSLSVMMGFLCSHIYVAVVVGFFLFIFFAFAFSFLFFKKSTRIYRRCANQYIIPYVTT